MTESFYVIYLSLIIFVRYFCIVFCEWLIFGRIFTVKCRLSYFLNPVSFLMSCLNWWQPSDVAVSEVKVSLLCACHVTSRCCSQHAFLPPVRSEVEQLARGECKGDNLLRRRVWPHVHSPPLGVAIDCRQKYRLFRRLRVVCLEQ